MICASFSIKYHVIINYILHNKHFLSKLLLMSVKIVYKIQKVGVIIENLFKVYCCSTRIHYKNIFEECFWMPKPYYTKIKIFLSNFKLRNIEFLEESNEYIYVILIEHKWFWQGIFLNSNINQLLWSNCYANLMQSMPPWNHLHFIDKQKSVLTTTYYIFFLY